LSEQVKSGEFRTDLYYRLNVIQIRIPPLRERKEDIPILIEQLLRRISAEQGADYKSITPDVMKALLRYRYPGNVRELSNILERALTLTSSSVIGVDDLPEPFGSSSVPGPLVATTLPPDGLNLDAALSELERSLIEQALERTSSVKTKAASLLGITFRSLRYRLSKLGIEDEDNSQE
jgi:two-component system response regulator PilR (NtrC family)